MIPGELNLMTAKQGLKIELGARTVSAAAKAPEKAAEDAD